MVLDHVREIKLNKVCQIFNFCQLDLITANTTF